MRKYLLFNIIKIIFYKYQLYNIWFFDTITSKLMENSQKIIKIRFYTIIWLL